MNKREAYAIGRDRGECVASWVDVPEVGDSIPLDIDWVGYKVVDANNLADVMEMYCHASEENDRQYSTFEFIAHEINSQDPDWRRDALWKSFDHGIEVGIRKEVKRRLREYAI